MSAIVRSVVGQEPGDVVGEVAVDEIGQVGGEQQLEAGGADVPAHGVQGVGVEPAAGGEHVGPAGVDLGGAMFADRDHRGGAVAEEPAADEEGHRGLGRRIGQRTQFDGDERGDVVGCAAQVVVQARDARGAGHAAQAEDRHAFDVGPQAQAPGDAGVQRRHRHAGDRRRDDDVEVDWLQAGFVERAGQGLAGEVDGVLDVEVVGFAEVGERGVLVERQDEMAAVDLGVSCAGTHEVLVLGEGRDRTNASVISSWV